MRGILILFLWTVTGISVMAQDHTIKVMTYNIRLPVEGDGQNYWDYRRHHVYTLINFHAPDLIGLQEAFRRQINEMVAELPDYGWFGVCRTDGTTKPNPDGEFSAILYRKDRFRLLDGSTFWLSRTPHQAGSVGWDAALPRIVTWAEFQDKLTGVNFYHFNTHFDHLGDTARLESARLLLHCMDSIAGKFPVVLTGDFNCTEDDPPYKTLTEAPNPIHVNDAMQVSKYMHHGPRSTFAANFNISGLVSDRIDFIFAKNKMEVIRHSILSDNWYGQLASDHLPVFAEVLPKGE